METPKRAGARRSRRERPAKPALSREGIVTAALAVLRAEGLEKVTMRRVAAELDTGAASLYVYIRDTEDLHAQLLDALLGPVADAIPADGTWRERLTAALTQYTSTLFDYPAIARLAFFNWPSGPNYLALIDLLLALLAEGGVPDRDAAWAIDLLMQFATAMAAEQGTREASERADEATSDLEAAIATVEATAYPNIARLGDELLSGDGSSRFAWGLDVLIAGILATRRSHPEQQRESDGNDND